MPLSVCLPACLPAAEVGREGGCWRDNGLISVPPLPACHWPLRAEAAIRVARTKELSHTKCSARTARRGRAAEVSEAAAVVACICLITARAISFRAASPSVRRPAPPPRSLIIRAYRPPAPVSWHHNSEGSERFATLWRPSKGGNLQQQHVVEAK